MSSTSKFKNRLASFSRVMFKLTHPPNRWHQAYFAGRMKIKRRSEGGYDVETQTGRMIQTRCWSELKNETAAPIFVVGSGPSLKDQAIERLADRPTILLNGAVSLVESHQFQPLAVCIRDARFVRDRWDFLKQIPMGSKVWFSASVIASIAEREADLLDRWEIWLNDDPEKPAIGKRVSRRELGRDDRLVITDGAMLSRDGNVGFFGSGTVMYPAAQAALYCGATKLCLVGFDLSQNAGPRFYEQDGNVAFSKIDKAIKRVAANFQLLRDVCDGQGVELLNLSPSSRLPRTIAPYWDLLE